MRRVKDFIEISDYTSLEGLINTLTALRDSLPEGAEPELRMRGDDVFGRRLSITYFRELTADEAACDARYTGAVLSDDNSEIEDLRCRLDKVPFERRNGSRRIRRAA